MKKMNYKILLLIALSFFVFFHPCVVNAIGSATTGFSGSSSVYVGNNIEVTLYVASVSQTESGLAAFGGTINYDSSKLELVSKTSLAPFTIDMEGNKIAGFGANTIKGNTNIMKFTFKAKETGTVTISYIGSRQPDLDNQYVEISGCSKTITITNPPSTNNNLSSLSTSVGSINFNKDITNYSLTVNHDVISINISASSEDTEARITGTGTKSLNYGSNRFDIIVTAPSGDKKTYTINITRQDNRSANNNLSSLKVNGGTLVPNFSKGTTNYTLSVPYSVSDLTIDAKPEDAKAMVNISGNSNLIAEQTKEVVITVTAENGSKKTYTINVTRGKDPNKVLSNNNYLAYLKVSVGILSPIFNKDNMNYEVWLPYEVDKISFDYKVEDTKYAMVNFQGNNQLQPGVNNVYKIVVKAENEEERTYTINVKRAKNPSQNTSSNTYLKSIELDNGKLIGNFDKEVHEYFYVRKDNFEIKEVLAEDEDSAVTIYEDGTIIYLIVTSSNGEYSVYTLREQEKDYFVYLIAFITFILGTILGLYLSKVIKKKNLEDKVDKPKQKNVKKIEQVKDINNKE